MSDQQQLGRRMHGCERFLTVWVLLCMGAGILLGRVAPGLARTLDGMPLDVNGAPVVSIPIAICLFFLMYPIMVEVPLMLGLVKFCLKTQNWFQPPTETADSTAV